MTNDFRGACKVAGQLRMTSAGYVKLRSNFELNRRFKMTSAKRKAIFPVAMRLRDTPVPIPNTMVKT